MNTPQSTVADILQPLNHLYDLLSYIPAILVVVLVLSVASMAVFDWIAKLADVDSKWK